MRKLSITALFLASFAAAIAAPPARAQVRVTVSIGGFYDELSPYGRWVDCRWGGCWVPERISRDWQPYSNGEWIYTDYGWTWLSDDPWGDDPYHYGTWAWTDEYGWVWIPGTLWAPAWVTWTYSDDYIGWAPLPPSLVVGWSGYSGSAVLAAPTSYVFVPTDRFVGTNVLSVRVPRDRSTTIFRRTRPVTRFAVSGGIVRNTAIPLETIQRRTGTRIERRSIRDAKTLPRPAPEWSRGERRQVAIVAPARDVREVVSSRPRRGSRSEGSLGTSRREVAPPPPARRVEKAPQKEVRAPRAAPQSEVRPPKAAPQSEVRPPRVAPQSEVRPPKAAPQKSLPPPAVQENRGRGKAIPPGEARPEKSNKGGNGKKEKPGKPGKG